MPDLIRHQNSSVLKRFSRNIDAHGIYTVFPYEKINYEQIIPYIICKCYNKSMCK